jgi:hypothetical protein
VPSVKDALEGYVAGRVKAERVVEVVAAEYYGRDAGGGMRDALRPVVEIIERAHPGVIELSGTADKPGFAVRLADRPFPKQHETSLREAALQVLGAHPAPRISHPGFFGRLAGVIRRFFTAST